MEDYIILDVDGVAEYDAELDTLPEYDMDADLAIVVNPIYVPEYEGEYVITPQATAQTLLTEGKKMMDNIRIEPIPSNYGLITWNGSTLTVS